jgi:cation diffusion facilitator CzcD-associated flavoprotein CzcO
MDDTPLPDHVHVLIVGAGFGGLGMAIRLQDRGDRDFLVVERGHDVGGTWRDNTYPGATCDVPSQLYSYSFSPNRSWSRSFSPQPEIYDYLRDVARRAGVLDRFAFDTAMTSAVWDDDEALWRVDTTRGTVTARTLVAAAGGLSEPRMPDLEGIDTFRGRIFHTARWNHDYDLAGRRVAVIGTGASAIQVVPQIAPKVAHLDVYQRSAPWVLPRHDRAYSRLERLAFRHLPALQKVYRAGIYWNHEALVPMIFVNPKAPGLAEKGALKHIREGIRDPQLRARVTPNFQIGCKRILVSNDYYPALDRPNVDLVTEPIARLTPEAVVTADGTVRRADAVIVATGFHAVDPPIARQVTGKHGETLAQVWARDGMAAYKGTTVQGFPNLFQIVGPNMGLGHSSMVFVIESQVTYIERALEAMRERGLATVEPSVSAQRAWNEDLQRRLARTVWTTGGCTSWYLDEHGRNPTLWPRTTVVMRRLLSRFDIDAYDVTRRTSRRTIRQPS